MLNELPLPFGTFHFTFNAFPDCPENAMAMAFRLRGLLGKTIRYANCIHDPASTPCKGCEELMQCFYGNGFETPDDCLIKGFGKVGSLPQLWSLHVERVGMIWRGELCLLGHEVERAAQWSQALEQTGIPLQWLAQSGEPEETLYWQACTPIRLRMNGKNPKAHELGAAIASGLARKTRMLAAMHGLEVPRERLPIPRCGSGEWLDVERFSFRKERVETFGGWMPHIVWRDDLTQEWRVWLALLRRFGIGRQTTFGFGRFLCVSPP